MDQNQQQSQPTASQAAETSTQSAAEVRLAQEADQKPVQAPEDAPGTQAGTETLAPLNPETLDTEASATPETDRILSDTTNALKDTLPNISATSTDASIANDGPGPVEPERADEEDFDKKYFKAANDVIDNYKDKPFEEEEMAEDLQIGYLKERFGKEIKKSED